MIFNVHKRFQAGVCERLNYVDDLSDLKRDKMDFRSATWFKSAYFSSFVSTYKDPYEYALFSCAYMDPLTRYESEVHPNWPAEGPVLMLRAQLIMQSMLTDLAALALTLLQVLWDYITNLEVRSHTLGYLICVRAGWLDYFIAFRVRLGYKFWEILGLDLY